MTRNFKSACFWLVALSQILFVFSALAQSYASQIGREVAIPIHLQDGDEFNIPLPQSYKKECQEKHFPFGSMPIDFLSWHSAQLPERALLSSEWSCSGEKFCLVSGCETEKQLFFLVVPFRCCDGAHRFSETQQA